MGAQFIEIEVEKRETTGKKARQEAIRRGLVPCTVYGGDKEPVSIFVEPRKIHQILRSEKGMNSILLFSLKGTKVTRHVMIKEYQIDPVNTTLLHADFQRIDMEKKVRVKVHIQCDGVAFGVKTQGGVVDHVTREVELECLPADVPDRLHIDMTPLKIGDSVRYSDLKIPERVVIVVDDLHAPVLSITNPRAEAAATTPEEGAVAEPEVIGKGKKPEEAAAGDAKKADKKK